MQPLVSTAWVAEHLGDRELRILDATVDVDVTSGLVESGRARWESGHIPGAAFADLLVDLSDPEAALPFTAPSAEQFASVMGRLGVGDGTRVVVYDARESMWAARLWWMLRAFGFDEAAVLDGGWTAWLQEGRPVSTERPDIAPTTFTPRPRSGLFVGKDRVLAALDEHGTRIVDALTRREYTGELAFYGRAGHIPGAVNVPARRIVDRDTQRFLPVPKLREMFAPVLSADRAITYCGGGTAASSDAFVLHLLGFEDVAVYDGSMMEWSADPDLPLVTGTE
jgi:thiosulfate/3-mercaptopyruvate sulfurtransferase